MYKVAGELANAEQLTTAADVMSPLAIRRPEEVERLARRLMPASDNAEPLTFAQAVNTTLATVLERQPNVLVFGEDVAVKGGVYGVTKGLMARAGAGRVFDTLLDETSILGLANGSAISGFVPIPEIEYLAYLHNAEDQLRGEAATLSFFSNGQYRNGLVVRVAGYGYQEGFGGHFHNDDAIAVLRDIPGLVVASPSRPDDAAAMLTTCVAAAQVDGTVSVFLEPIARYHTQDLFEPSDRGWMAPIESDDHVPIGKARTYGDGRDLTIVTCGNGVLLSMRTARRLAGRGVGVRVVDLRWLAPLPIDDIVRETACNPRRADRRRDQGKRRLERRCDHSIGGGRHHHPNRQGHEQGQLHPAGRCCKARVAQRGRDRSRRIPPVARLTDQAPPCHFS